MPTRDFPLADVISVIAGRKLSPAGMRGITDVLNFLTGEKTYPHQIGRVLQECAPILQRQLPHLDLDYTVLSPDNTDYFLGHLSEQYGDTVTLSPLESDAHRSIDPVEELLDGQAPVRRPAHTVDASQSETPPAKKSRRRK